MYRACRTQNRSNGPAGLTATIWECVEQLENPAGSKTFEHPAEQIIQITAENRLSSDSYYELIYDTENIGKYIRDVLMCDINISVMVYINKLLTLLFSCS